MVLINPSSIGLLHGLKEDQRRMVMSSLSNLSKFLGIYSYWKQLIQGNNLKWQRRNSLKAFIRILKAQDSNIMEWLREAYEIARENEKLFLKFCLLTGMRKQESVNSFNLIVKLAREGKLKSYYNADLKALQHFMFEEIFIRRNKNVYISFVHENLINKIANSKPISYNSLRLRLRRRNMKTRISELRDYFGTYLLKHGILREEIDLLQGRVPTSVFIRYYWSPNFKDLKSRVLNALEMMNNEITSQNISI